MNIVMYQPDRELIDLILEECCDEIDFSQANNDGETIFHKLCIYLGTTYLQGFFNKYPDLLVIFNQQLNLPNKDSMTPMDYLTRSVHSYPDEDYVNFFIDNVSFENIKMNYNKFVFCSHTNVNSEISKYFG